MFKPNAIIAAVCGAFLLLFLAAPGIAETVTVPGGSQDEIQEAVNEAGEGGTVILSRGDHLVTKTVVIKNDSVRILGRGGSEIVARSDSEGGLLPIFEVYGAHFRLKGVRVRGSTESVGDISLAVADGADALSVTGCRGERIVQLVSATDCYEVRIQGNRVDAANPLGAQNLEMILVEGGGRSRIRGNRLVGPRASGTAGISCSPIDRNRFVVSGNQITGFDTGIEGDGEGELEITRNKVLRCTNGMDLAATTTALYWKIERNTVSESLAAGIYLEDGDNCRVSRNKVFANATDGISIGGVLVTLFKNFCRLNAGSGMFLEANSCRIEKCKVVRNGRGLRVEGTGNSLRRNRAIKNNGDGIVTVGGNTNDGGNRAMKNGGVNISIQ